MGTFQLTAVDPSDELELSTFHATLRALFTADNDAWSRDGLRRYQQQQAGYGIQVEYLLSRIDGEISGMMWACIDPSLRVAYLPYGGLLPRFRHTGAALKIDDAISDHLRTCFQTAVQIGDCQNPARVPGPEPRDRIRYLQSKSGYSIVDDADFPYVRPGSGEGAYLSREDEYLLAFKVIDPGGIAAVQPRDFKDQQVLSLRSYRWLYVALMRLDIGGHGEADLHQRAPAIREFLARVDAGLRQDPERQVRLLAAVAGAQRR